MSEFFKPLLDKLLGGISPAQTKLIFGGGWILFLFFVFEELAALSGPEKLGYSILTIAGAVLLILAVKDILDDYLKKKEEKKRRPAKEFKALADDISVIRVRHNKGISLKKRMRRDQFQSLPIFANDISAKEVLRARLGRLGIRTPPVFPPAGSAVGGKTERDHDAEWSRFLIALHPMAVLGNIEEAREFTEAEGYPPFRGEH